MSTEKFEQYAIVELFGHQRIAGLVSEQTIGGCQFVRVDVPAVDSAPAYTKLFGQGAIYAISIVEEKVAIAAASRLRVRPIMPYELPSLSSQTSEQDQYGD